MDNLSENIGDSPDKCIWQEKYKDNHEKLVEIKNKISESVSKSTIGIKKSADHAKNISIGRKKWIQENPEKVRAANEKMKETKRQQSLSGELSQNHYSNTHSPDDLDEIYTRIASKSKATKKVKKELGIYSDVWNKGLTKENDDSIAAAARKARITRRKNKELRDIIKSKIIYDEKEILAIIQEIKGRNDLIFYRHGKVNRLTVKAKKIKDSKIWIGYCSCSKEQIYNSWLSFLNNYLRIESHPKCAKCRNVGRILSDLTKERQSIAAKNKNISNEVKLEIGKKISKALKRWHASLTVEERSLLGQKISQGQRNKSVEDTVEWRRKVSIKRREEMRLKGESDKFRPSYNLSSIPIIETYGKIHGYNFRHALNHESGEYKIYDPDMKTTYYADGYDVINNVWIEYDEDRKFHNGALTEDHVLRQNRIEKILKCKFIRIKEGDNLWDI